jgi:hypothetical protein
MTSALRRSVLVLLFGAMVSLSSAASPANSRLICLVPPGAQIVAGFENYRDPRHHGQLVLATRNNRLDLEDWQAIAGVDHRRRFEEVVEVAYSPVGGMLTEHLLLVAGKFNSERIYRSAELIGAKRSAFEGQALLEIEPFAREKGKMLATRWLVILGDRVAMLGTPLLVQSAIHRYLNRVDTDMALRERLAQLPPDVSSWNVLTSLPKARTEYTVAQAKSPWARFFEEADVLMVGVRFGPKIRVHFSLHASGDRGQEFFKRKAVTFASVFGAGRNGRRPSVRLMDVAVDSDHVQGSVELSREQFDTWGDWTNNFGHLPPPPGHTGGTGH